VDRSRERAEKIAAQWGTKGEKRYRKIYEMVDAVSIAVPTELHHKVASEFLSRGIHCLVEKPITATVEDAEDLIRLASENGAILQVGHSERFNSAIRYMREILDKPAFIECHRLGPYDPRVAGVGVVLDLMIHDIDLVLQIVQSPLASMDAVGISVVSDKEDIANVRLKFENGATANLTVSRVSPRKQRKVRVFQKDSYLSIDCIKQSMEWHKRVLNPKAREGEPKAEILLKKVRIKKEEPLKLELDDFVDSILQERTPMVTGEHARDALHIAVEVGKLIAQNNVAARFS
jgi:predicted dehydrogenase